MRIEKHLLTVAVVSLCSVFAMHGGEGNGPLRLVKTFPLPPEVKGHFDHLAIDLEGHRLFLTPEDYKAVLVLDSQDGHLLKTISGISKPHAILYRGDLGRLYVTD